MSKTKIADEVSFTSLDNFKRKFKITSDILSPMEEIWEEYPEALLAGGKLIDFFLNKPLSESVNDYDVYNMNGFEICKKKGKEVVTLFHLYEAKINNYMFQFMNHNADGGIEPEELISNFDFRCCAICTNGKYIWWVQGCLQDIRDKKLTTLNPRLSMGTHIRLSKYLAKGYSIDYPSYITICINSLDTILKSKRDNKVSIALNRSFNYDRSDLEYEVVENDIFVAPQMQPAFEDGMQATFAEY